MAPLSRPELGNLLQRRDIDPGVMCGHIERTVTQNRANSFECGPCAQHRGCQPCGAAATLRSTGDRKCPHVLAPVAAVISSSRRIQNRGTSDGPGRDEGCPSPPPVPVRLRNSSSRLPIEPLNFRDLEQTCAESLKKIVNVGLVH